MEKQPKSDLTGCMEDLLSTARETRQLLEKIEYVIEYGTRKRYCPLCEEPEDAGHISGCLLKQVKRDIEIVLNAIDSASSSRQETNP